MVVLHSSFAVNDKVSEDFSPNPALPAKMTTCQARFTSTPLG